MNLNDKEMLRLLAEALVAIKQEYTRKEEKTTEEILLTEALELIGKAKVLAKASDKKLIEDFQNQVERLCNKPATPENVANLKHLYTEFGAEIYMSLASIGFTNEQYNRFLLLLDVPEVGEFLWALPDRIDKRLDKKYVNSLFELGFIKSMDKRIVLTTRGLSFSQALRLIKHGE